MIRTICRQRLVLATILLVMLGGCGSTNRAAPVEDRTSATVSSPRAESRTQTSQASSQTQDTVTAKTSAAKTSSPETSAPSTPAPEPVTTVEDWRPDYYTVRKGDTLYSIALDFGQDYRDVAAWNQLPDASYIQIGQRLRVSEPEGAARSGSRVLAPATLPGSRAEKTAASSVPTFDEPVAYRSEYSQQAHKDLERQLGKAVETTVVDAGAKPAANPGQTTKPATTAATPTAQAPKPARGPNERLHWEWPASGNLLYSFNKGPMKKGVAIQGKPGQAVVSSAPGKVVYSGSGLRGYGNLIIVKHNSTYLSVYAHNRQLLVSEGQMVAQGQKIGVMGEISPGKTALHFEIRRQGKPMDPLKFLPEKAS